MLRTKEGKMIDWPNCYDTCEDCQKMYNLDDLIIINEKKDSYMCLECYKKHKYHKLIDLVYAYQPTETSPDGMTWEQVCLQHEKTISELKERIAFLEQKLYIAVKKLDKYE